MTHHQEAWQHVKPHLFGTVCEVTRTKPWGFYHDRPDIINVTVDEFLDEHYKRYDTVILHILSGEGERRDTIKEVLNMAHKVCIKLVILEHNPDSDDFDLLPDVGFMPLRFWGQEVIHENWGRNMLWAGTTFEYLELPQLSDSYFNEHINKSFIKKGDHGIDVAELIYTHTSEAPIDFELPETTTYWVIGGGIAYESMEDYNRNILIDSILKQVLYAAWHYELDWWKVERLCDFNDLDFSKSWPKWRVVDSNWVTPNAIKHLPIQDLNCKGCVVYVSTVHKMHWEHLIQANIILDAWTDRYKIKIY